VNFYNDKLVAHKYFKIIKKYKNTFTKTFILQNFGLFVGDKSFYKILTCFEILKNTKKIKGDIIEFGVWNGNNLLTLKKILDFLNIQKKLYGFDHFRGMPKKYSRKFIGDINLIKYVINFFKLKNIFLINDNILNLKKHQSKLKKISLIYVDCDIYETTKLILDELHSKISKGGYIVFDEGNQRRGTGESLAMENFYSKNKNKFKKIYLKEGYQPDVILQKK
jgi:hypothetical protein|tara:strand:+ start:12107 stop:12772 length:666 start_codon:yes stop_codon:yes gene_type:complete